MHVNWGGCTFRRQNGGALHDAEIHLVHVRKGTKDNLLVVGVMLDASTYGLNSVVGFIRENDIDHLLFI